MDAGEIVERLDRLYSDLSNADKTQPVSKNVIVAFNVLLGECKKVVTDDPVVSVIEEFDTSPRPNPDAMMPVIGQLREALEGPKES